MSKIIEKYKCKIGIHKWGPLREQFVKGQVKLASKCEFCSKIKEVKDK